MNLDLTFSETASGYIRKMLDQKEGVVFRLSVKKTGCSGFSYLPTIVDKPEPGDIELNLPAGLQIYIDAAWIDLLQGVRIDYVEENKSGLKQKRLVFSNPNESGRCGCGESFHVD